MNTDELTPRQKNFIPLLLANSVTDACKEAKIGRKTAYDWLKQKPFRDALELARDDVFNEGMGHIKANVSDAIDVIIELMRTAEKEDSRIRAAQIIIEHARWLRTSEGLGKRIEQLERALS
jgi:hypothetical protein